jgi:hypothetical protein
MSSRKNPATPLRRRTTNLGIGLSVLASIAFTGCGTPGAPQPPSLNLPETVADLTAVRAGSSVALHWTMPKKTVDHLLIKSAVAVSICWREGSGPCQQDGTTTASPGIAKDFVATLPANLTTGDPRPVSFFVELKSPKGRSAGLSNAAILLAGQAPGAVSDLAAKVQANGAALSWSGAEITTVRLHRKLLTPPAPRSSAAGPLKPSPEPPLRDLLVVPEADSPAGALDKTARFGEEYEYTAQRVLQIPADGKTLEIAGAVSAPIRVQMVDTFPPTVPQGLVAVFVPEDKTIDLSWEPDSDPDMDGDLAGYIVYRAEAGANDGDPNLVWKRVSPTAPIAGTSYRDTTILAGHNYRYAVSAIDQTGHESKRSEAATESAPNP